MKHDETYIGTGLCTPNFSSFTPPPRYILLLPPPPVVYYWPSSAILYYVHGLVSSSVCVLLFLQALAWLRHLAGK